MTRTRKQKSSDGLVYLGVVDRKRRYRARITWRNPKTGRREIDTDRDIYADSKIEALQARAKLREQLIGEAQGARRATATVAEVADAWFETVEAAGSRHSWGSHKRKVEAALGPRRISEVTMSELREHMVTLEHLSRSMRNTRRDVLIKIWGAAMRQGWLERNIARDLERAKDQRSRSEIMAELEGVEPVKRSIAPEHIGAFLQRVREERGGEYAALILTQLALGCRFGEVSALQVTDVDWQTGLVTIRRSQREGVLGPPKGKKARQAMLGEAGLDMLKAHRRRMMAEQRPGLEEGWLFVREPSPRRKHSVLPSISTYHNVLRRCFKDVGLELASSTHALRHTMNNLARQQIGDGLLGRAMGHGSTRMQLVYTEVEMQELQKLARAVEGHVFSSPPLSPPPL